jgi:hypothetical protein
MTKTIFSSLLTIALATAFSAVAFADETPAPETTTYTCTAGTTIPKHVISFFGDACATQQEAIASAMANCREQSEFSDYCRPLNCFENDSTN